MNYRIVNKQTMSNILSASSGPRIRGYNAEGFFAFAVGLDLSEMALRCINVDLSDMEISIDGIDINSNNSLFVMTDSTSSFVLNGRNEYTHLLWFERKQSEDRNRWATPRRFNINQLSISIPWTNEWVNDLHASDFSAMQRMMAQTNITRRREMYNDPEDIYGLRRTHGLRYVLEAFGWRNDVLELNFNFEQ